MSTVFTNPSHFKSSIAIKPSIPLGKWPRGATGLYRRSDELWKVYVSTRLTALESC